jgi:hypothetical protein
MDILNDFYPLYPPNPDKEHLSESDISDDLEHLTKLEKLNYVKMKKKAMVYDDFFLKHSDDMWYLWCIINEFTCTNSLYLLDRLNYTKFCDFCYEYSTKY